MSWGLVSGPFSLPKKTVSFIQTLAFLDEGHKVATVTSCSVKTGPTVAPRSREEALCWKSSYLCAESCGGSCWTWTLKEHQMIAGVRRAQSCFKQCSFYLSENVKQNTWGACVSPQRKRSTDTFQTFRFSVFIWRIQSYKDCWKWTLNLTHFVTLN